MTFQGKTSLIAITLLPLVLLSALIFFLYHRDPLKSLRPDVPPVEVLAFERVKLGSDGIMLNVINDGPDPITIAQVAVDDAYWRFAIVPSNQIEPLQRATLRVPYPWVHGELHRVKLFTSTGLTFEHEIEVASETPRPSWSYLWVFAMVGIYVGVIPVLLGLFWFPVLRRLSDEWMEFFLFLTIGLLFFLGIDAVEEGLEVAEKIPHVYQGFILLMLGIVVAFGLLTVVDRSIRGEAVQSGKTSIPVTLAYMIAIGIGLHNLSEGLAIGAAYTLGEITLGTMLIIGFTLHNTTEGLAIVSPISRSDVRIKQLALMGAMGGLPTILGAWLGGFVYSAPLALLFLAIGAGAIFQVIYQIGHSMTASKRSGSVLTFQNLAGLLIGFLIMYLTGRWVIV